MDNIQFYRDDDYVTESHFACSSPLIEDMGKREPQNKCRMGKSERQDKCHMGKSARQDKCRQWLHDWENTIKEKNTYIKFKRNNKIHVEKMRLKDLELIKAME